MKLYPLGIVGESNYQTEIGRAREGESVLIVHEPDNPYDELALRVDRKGGSTIGYVAKSSWLRSAIHEEGRGAAATIASISRGQGEHLGVVLHVTLTDDDVFERGYKSAEQPTDPDLGRRVINSLWKGLTGRRK